MMGTTRKDTYENTVKKHKSKGLYMFADEREKPLGPDKPEDRYLKFRKALLAAHPELPALTYHELRYTYATRLNEERVPDNTIALLMGHRKDSKMTNEVYIHQNIDHIKQAMGLTQKDSSSEADRG